MYAPQPRQTAQPIQVMYPFRGYYQPVTVMPPNRDGPARAFLCPRGDGLLTKLPSNEWYCPACQAKFDNFHWKFD